MKLNRIFLLAFSLWLSASPLVAQKDRQARKVLDQTVATLQQGGGIYATFIGSSEGTLQLKGDRFYLNSNGIQSWFDGKTQWSYVENSEEVNITNPTPEELQPLHPMALLSLYRHGYNYRYNGTQPYDGQTAHVITLTPEATPKPGQPGGQPNIQRITVLISQQNLPLYIKMEPKHGPAQEFMVTSCQLHQSLNDATFTFDRKKYPNAEVIDLR